EGDLPVPEVLPYIDRCLGCMACVTACPSGVEYGDLLAPFRAWTEAQRARPVEDAAARTLAQQTLPYPERFRLAALAGNLAKPLKGMLPAKLRAMIDLLPEQVPASAPLPEMIPAQGKRRARVALLAGCVQQVLSPVINQATVAVLAHNGVEVVIPRRQGCCGSLALHTGEADQARRLAWHNLAAFPGDVDAVVTNAAGCGSGMRDYGLLFAGSAWEESATAFAARVKDLSVFLDELGNLRPAGLDAPRTVAYHDACHLAHAQRVTQPPRRLLAQIANLE